LPSVKASKVFVWREFNLHRQDANDWP
jgi:hypothetical protein